MSTESQLRAKKNIRRYIKNAIKAWELYNTSDGIEDNSDYWYDKALKIAKYEGSLLNYKVNFDFPGLYPTYILTNEKTGKNYTEYSIDGFFNRINGIYD